MICDMCGKRRMAGNKVSHSNIKTRRIQSANVQKVRAIVDGKIVRLHVCTRCLRTGRVTKVA